MSNSNDDLGDAIVRFMMAGNAIITDDRNICGCNNNAGITKEEDIEYKGARKTDVEIVE